MFSIHRFSPALAYILQSVCSRNHAAEVSPNTVSDYVEALTESFIFYPAERFDIVGKQLQQIRLRKTLNQLKEKPRKTLIFRGL